MSETCYQEINYGCKMAPLKNIQFGHYFGWWTDKDGSKNFYIDGDDKDSPVCGCHATSSCYQSMFNSSCNCDAVFLPLWSSDQGKLTNKESLPVRSFVYSGFISKQQEANITVGKLKCSGSNRNTEKTSITATCSSLKQGGATRDAYYLTKDKPDESIKASYCQMSKQGFTEDSLNLESHHLGSKSKLVFRISVQSHYTNVYASSTRRTCNSDRNYYNLKDVVLKPKDENIDLYETFSKEDGSYEIHDTGLYTVIIMHMDGQCDNYYLVDVDESGGTLGKQATNQFYKSDYTNTFTQWLSAGTKLQIKTRYSQYQSNSSFKMTIVKV